MTLTNSVLPFWMKKDICLRRKTFSSQNIWFLIVSNFHKQIEKSILPPADRLIFLEIQFKTSLRP